MSSPVLNRSVQDVLQEVSGSGMLPIETSTLSGIATSNTNVPSTFSQPPPGSMKFGSFQGTPRSTTDSQGRIPTTNSSRLGSVRSPNVTSDLFTSSATPSAPMKSSMSPTSSVGSIRPTNLFPSSPQVQTESARQVRPTDLFPSSPQPSVESSRSVRPLDLFPSSPTSMPSSVKSATNVAFPSTPNSFIGNLSAPNAPMKSYTGNTPSSNSIRPNNLFPTSVSEMSPAETPRISSAGSVTPSVFGGLNTQVSSPSDFGTDRSQKSVNSKSVMESNGDFASKPDSQSFPIPFPSSPSSPRMNSSQNTSMSPRMSQFSSSPVFPSSYRPSNSPPISPRSFSDSIPQTNVSQSSDNSQTSMNTQSVRSPTSPFTKEPVSSSLFSSPKFPSSSLPQPAVVSSNVSSPQMPVSSPTRIVPTQGLTMAPFASSRNNSKPTPQSQGLESPSIGSGGMSIRDRLNQISSANKQSGGSPSVPSSSMGSSTMNSQPKSVQSGIMGSPANTKQIAGSMNEQPIGSSTLSSSPKTVGSPSVGSGGLSIKDKLNQISLANKQSVGSSTLSSPPKTVGSPSIGSGGLSIKDRLNQISIANKQAVGSSRANSPPKTVGSLRSPVVASTPTSGSTSRVGSMASPRSLSTKSAPTHMSGSKMVHHEEQFTADLNSIDTVKPVEVSHEDPLAPHKVIFTKYGITFDKIFPEHDEHTSFVHCYTREGDKFVVEIKHTSGTTIYLSSGMVLERHVGEELDISSTLLKKECTINGTCGFFGQEGNKAIVGHHDASMKMRSYIVSSLETERSFLESHGIIALPLIQFEQLEYVDPVDANGNPIKSAKSVENILLYVASQYKEYAFKAAAETRQILQKAIDDLDTARSILTTYKNEYGYGYDRLKLTEEFVSRNLSIAKGSNNEPAFEENATYRVNLFRDLSTAIHGARELSKVVEFSSHKGDMYTEKLYELRRTCAKYN